MNEDKNPVVNIVTIVMIMTGAQLPPICRTPPKGIAGVVYMLVVTDIMNAFVAEVVQHHRGGQY